MYFKILDNYGLYGLFFIFIFMFAILWIWNGALIIFSYLNVGCFVSSA